MRDNLFWGEKMKVNIEREGNVCMVIINRPEVRNAVDCESAQLLYDAFTAFEGDDTASVAVLYGAGGHFCAGADLKAIAEGRSNRVEPEGSAPMGPTRLLLSKPIIAAVSGYAVAGGLELALWCDLRVVEENAVLGVFCRRFGVPLIDGGTVRLARLIGVSRALDMILTGRPVKTEEAFQMGLANRIVPKGKSLEEAIALAKEIARFPQVCLRNDRLSLYEGFNLDFKDAMENEFRRGMHTLKAGEASYGAEKFKQGQGKHGTF
jgi:enoyl-CoA hydratase